jgi:hypothetical protein
MRPEQDSHRLYVDADTLLIAFIGNQSGKVGSIDRSL